MDLYEAIKGRRSIRRFKETPVPRVVVNKLVEAASYAPSACNEQLWQFVAVDNKSFREHLSKVCPPISVIHPPLVIFALYDKYKNVENYANVQSAAAAIQNLLLSAYSEGLGSLWMGEFGDEERIKNILNIPKNYMIIAGIVLGYPDEKYSPPKRRPLGDILHFFPVIDIYSFPKSNNPKDWRLDQIQKYVGYTVRAKSPTSVSFPPPYLREFETLIDVFPKIKGKTLFLYPFKGNYITSLSMKGKLRNLVVLGISPDIIKFVEYKRSARGDTNKYTYARGLGILPFKSNAFDSVVCIKKLEEFSKPENVIKELERVLKKDGRLHLCYSNSFSLFYIIWSVYHTFKKKRLDISGPFKPISPIKIKKMLKYFKILESSGVCLLPKTKTEDYRTSSLIKYFCKNILLTAKL